MEKAKKCAFCGKEITSNTTFRQREYTDEVFDYCSDECREYGHYHFVEERKQLSIERCWKHIHNALFDLIDVFDQNEQGDFDFEYFKEEYSNLANEYEFLNKIIMKGKLK